MENGIHAMVRTETAGVFVGTLDRRDGGEVELTDARRIWSWTGAASLSELAQVGTSNPEECKFPIAVDRLLLLGVIEIIPTTATARESFDAVPVWSAHS